VAVVAAEPAHRAPPDAGGPRGGSSHCAGVRRTPAGRLGLTRRSPDAGAHAITTSCPSEIDTQDSSRRRNTPSFARPQSVEERARPVAVTWAILLIGVAFVIAVALLTTRDTLFGTDPTAIHGSAWLGGRIHVCGRDYDGGSTAISRASWGRDAPFVLVDPAPFAPCRPVVDDPGGMCAAEHPACRTWTVVFVRVGADAFAPFELVGGP
jgi:hypothetical protein